MPMNALPVKKPHLYAEMSIVVVNGYTTFLRDNSIVITQSLKNKLITASYLRQYTLFVKELDEVLNTQYGDPSFNGFDYLTKKEDADKGLELLTSSAQTETEILNAELNRIHHTLYEKFTTQSMGKQLDAMAALSRYYSLVDDKDIKINRSILMSIQNATTPTSFRSAVAELDAVLNAAYGVSSFNGAVLLSNKINKTQISEWEREVGVTQVYRKTKTKLFDSSPNRNTNFDGKEKDKGAALFTFKRRSQ